MFRIQMIHGQPVTLKGLPDRKVIPLHLEVMCCVTSGEHPEIHRILWNQEARRAPDPTYMVTGCHWRVPSCRQRVQ